MTSTFAGHPLDPECRGDADCWLLHPRLFGGRRATQEGARTISDRHRGEGKITVSSQKSMIIIATSFVSPENPRLRGSRETASRDPTDEQPLRPEFGEGDRGRSDHEVAGPGHKGGGKAQTGHCKPQLLQDC